MGVNDSACNLWKIKIRGYFDDQNEQTHQFSAYIKLYCNKFFSLHAVSNWL